jgi:hypothetical protein
MSAPELEGDAGTAGEEEPPVLPLPSPEVHHLGRWEGILGWAIGWIAGMAIAAGALVALILR